MDHAHEQAQEQLEGHWRAKRDEVNRRAREMKKPAGAGGAPHVFLNLLIGRSGIASSGPGGGGGGGGVSVISVSQLMF